MVKLSNKKLSETNKYKIRDESIIIIDILLGLLCFIYSNVVVVDLMKSIIFSFTFMLLLVVIDMKIVMNISNENRKEILVDEMINLILIFKSYYPIEKAIIVAFSKIADPIFLEEDSDEKKLDEIAKYFNSVRYDIFYKACMTSSKYETLTCMKDVLKNKNNYLNEYLLISKECKWFMAIFFIVELCLIYFHSFYSEALLKGEGIILHIIMCAIFVIVYLFLSINISKDFKKGGVKKFIDYFICYGSFEKPFVAFDDACVIAKDIGESLIINKNLLIENHIDEFYDFLKEFSKEEQSGLLYVYECLKRNNLIKTKPVFKETRNENYNYLLKLFVIVPLFSLLSLFIIEVFYL